MVTTGPLTNLALAFRTRPEVISRLERVVVLGGAWGLGNKTAAAEWNILCDPEAASIVLSAGAPVTLVPIDAAAQVTIDEELVAIVRGAGRRRRSFRRRASHVAPLDPPARSRSGRARRRSTIRWPSSSRPTRGSREPSRRGWTSSSRATHVWAHRDRFRQPLEPAAELRSRRRLRRRPRPARRSSMRSGRLS